MGWILYDSHEHKYRSYSISDLGYFRVYDVIVEERKIKFQGELERGSMSISKDGNFMNIYWEQNTGTDWKVICSLEGRKQELQ